MDNQTFFTTVARLAGTVEQLEKTISILTIEVKELQRKQNYWTGAVAAVGVVCSFIGGVVALGLQWLHK